VIELSETLAHAVEGVGKLSHLVLHGIGDRLLEIASGDAAGRVLEAPDAAREAPRRDEADEPGRPRCSPD
jgi:hypothetical protein